MAKDRRVQKKQGGVFYVNLVGKKGHVKGHLIEKDEVFPETNPVSNYSVSVEVIGDIF